MRHGSAALSLAPSSDGCKVRRTSCNCTDTVCARAGGPQGGSQTRTGACGCYRAPRQPGAPGRTRCAARLSAARARARAAIRGDAGHDDGRLPGAVGGERAGGAGRAPVGRAVPARARRGAARRRRAAAGGRRGRELRGLPRLRYPAAPARARAAGPVAAGAHARGAHGARPPLAAATGELRRHVGVPSRAAAPAGTVNPLHRRRSSAACAHVARQPVQPRAPSERR